MAMAGTDHSSGIAFVEPKAGDHSSPRTCSHCNKLGHDIASCFKLIGRLEWWEKTKPASSGRIASRGRGIKRPSCCKGSGGGGSATAQGRSTTTPCLGFAVAITEENAGDGSGSP